MIVPLMLLILIALTDYAAMALARVELKNATDAAALSAVKSWSQQGADAAVRDAELLFLANPVIRRTLEPNDLATSKSNVTPRDENSPMGPIAGGVILGWTEEVAGMMQFHPMEEPGTEPSAGAGRSRQLAVAYRRTIRVAGLSPGWLGLPLGPYETSAESFARLSPQTGRPELIFVDASTIPSNAEADHDAQP
jgi:hypothetical protein